VFRGATAATTADVAARKEGDAETYKLPSFGKIKFLLQLEGCLTVHLLHEIILNANLMQKVNFINVFLARHVSGTYAHHQEH